MTKNYEQGHWSYSAGWLTGSIGASRPIKGNGTRLSSQNPKAATPSFDSILI
ncbi:MAG: hypothetical protein RMY16_18260 [Nostoc sp. DedQUE12b]|uniref:hypothetical protein n=1 Tax=Nostoc sp. DedQUE12b TaxID=3075398 RepID=UPI002AD44638|nr:hypothetical protein [Nostoc sp. DedQUE12b]MDZ8087483.1 hypothetical protein [Nostoc sp. DedQUE12b]